MKNSKFLDWQKGKNFRKTSKWEKFLNNSNEFELKKNKMFNQIKKLYSISKYLHYDFFQYKNYYYLKIQLISGEFCDFIFDREGILVYDLSCSCIDDENLFLIDKNSKCVAHIRVNGNDFDIICFFGNVCSDIKRIDGSSNLIKISDCNGKYMLVYNYKDCEVIVNNCISCCNESGILSTVVGVENGDDSVNLSVLLDMNGNLIYDIWDLTNFVNYSIDGRINSEGKILTKTSEIIGSICEEVYSKLIANKPIRRIKKHE